VVLVGTVGAVRVTFSKGKKKKKMRMEMAVKIGERKRGDEYGAKWAISMINGS